MRKKEHIEDLISSSLTEILERSMTLDMNDQIAIYQELTIFLKSPFRKELIKSSIFSFFLID